MAVRAVRGATMLARDDPQEMAEAVVELVEELLTRNELDRDDLISILFTATPDLVSCFPATAARAADLGDVPLICAQGLSIEGALPRVVRLMATVTTDRTRAEISHVYLRGAEVLRQDLAQ